MSKAQVLLNLFLTGFFVGLLLLTNMYPSEDLPPFKLLTLSLGSGFLAITPSLLMHILAFVFSSNNSGGGSSGNGGNSHDSSGGIHSGGSSSGGDSGCSGGGGDSGGC